jgi:hypothetical protein
MLDETYYLCRVPAYDIIVMFNERDYRYQRLVESQMNVPNEANNVVLLAQGTKKQVRMYYDLIKEDNNVS